MDAVDMIVPLPQSVIDLIDRAAEQQGNTRNDYLYILLIYTLWSDLGPAEAFEAERDLKNLREQLRALDLDNR